MLDSELYILVLVEVLDTSPMITLMKSTHESATPKHSVVRIYIASLCIDLTVDGVNMGNNPDLGWADLAGREPGSDHQLI